MKRLILLCVLGLEACGGGGDEPQAMPDSPPVAQATPATPPPIDAFVKGLSGSIQSAEAQKILSGLHGEIPDPPIYFVEVVLKRDFSWGGAQDWNAVASAVSVIAGSAFERPDLARLRLRVVDSSGFEWAYIDYLRHKLPTGWKESSYLQRFAAADVSGGHVQANTALCEFYAKYESARPSPDKLCRPPPAKLKRR